MQRTPKVDGLSITDCMRSAQGERLGWVFWLVELWALWVVWWVAFPVGEVFAGRRQRLMATS